MNINKKSNSKAAKVIKLITKHMANVAYGSSSIWGSYQPKEPEKLIK